MIVLTLILHKYTYFHPKKNEEYEVHKFRKVKQIDEETIDVFHTQLGKIAVNCEFNDVDREIKHQIVQTCRNRRLRMRALQESPSLNNLLVMGRSMEMSAVQAEEMEKKQVMNVAKSKRMKLTKKTCLDAEVNFLTRKNVLPWANLAPNVEEPIISPNNL